MGVGILAIIGFVIFGKYYYQWRFKELNERDELVDEWENELKK